MKSLLETFDEQYFKCLGCKKFHEVSDRHAPLLCLKNSIGVMEVYPPREKS